MGLAKTIRLWACDNCGHIGAWNENWRHKMILHRKPVPHDEDLVVCSPKCATELDARRRGKKTLNTVQPNAELRGVSAHEVNNGK